MLVVVKIWWWRRKNRTNGKIFGISVFDGDGFEIEKIGFVEIRVGGGVESVKLEYNLSEERIGNVIVGKMCESGIPERETKSMKAQTDSSSSD